jgi:transmembrane sensor
MSTSMNETSKRAKILAEAAEWHQRISDPGFSEEDHSLWLEWIESDPECARTFDEVEGFVIQLDEAADQLRDYPIPQTRELELDDYDPETPVSHWLARQSPTKTDQTNSRFVWAIAATVLLAITAAITISLTDIWSTDDGGALQTYVTIPSEHRTVNLDDGSKIEIGADSIVTVDYSDEQRTVILENGEAFFNVASDSSRPFRVLAGTGTITAIGTEFNVRRESDRVLVTVTEGIVTVSKHANSPSGAGNPDVGVAYALTPFTTRLGIGQQVAYDSGGLTDVVAADPAIATSWKDRRLQYLREPLRFVISGVNRYSEFDIVVADSALGDLKFTGTVYDGQTDEWLEGLSKALPVEVIYVGNSTVLLKLKE